MKAYRSIIFLAATGSLCLGALVVEMVKTHDTITGYDSDMWYTFQGKVWNTSALQYESVKACDLNYPQQPQDLRYTSERSGVSADEKLGFNERKVKRGEESENNRSSGDRTFKLQLKANQSWVAETLSWTQKTASGDPPSEG